MLFWDGVPPPRGRVRQMGLYAAVDNRLDIDDFLNDTIIYVAQTPVLPDNVPMTWQDLVTSNNLDPQEETEHSASVTYWQDLYDAAPTDSDKDTVKSNMDRILRHAYRACDRRMISEATFLETIGATEVITRIQRQIPGQEK